MTRDNTSKNTHQEGSQRWLKKVPIMYTSSRDEDPVTTTFTVKIDGEKIYERIAIYEEGSPELLLRTVRDFVSFVDSYELWSEMSDKSVYAKFRRCLKGDSRDAWDDLVSGETQTELEFEDYLKDWIEGELGTNAYKAQIKYLKKTSKPSNIDVKKWIKKVRNINAFLPLMSSKAAKMTDNELLEHVILENIPNKWIQECDLKGIDEDSKWSEVVDFLLTCEENFPSNSDRHGTRDNRHQRDNRNPKDNSNSNNNRNQRGTRTSGKSGNSSSTLKNPCKLPNHEKHEWSSCFNNPNSTKFKGTALTPKDFDSDGKRIKAEQNNVEKEKKKAKNNEVSLDTGYDSDSNDDEEFNHTIERKTAKEL